MRLSNGSNRPPLSRTLAPSADVRNGVYDIHRLEHFLAPGGIEPGVEGRTLNARFAMGDRCGHNDPALSVPWRPAMKAMSAREAKTRFGVAIDAAQHEAVIITRRDRPAAALVSMEEIAQIPRYRAFTADRVAAPADRAEKIMRWLGSLHGTFGDADAIDASIRQDRAAWDR